MQRLRVSKSEDRERPAVTRATRKKRSTAEPFAGNPAEHAERLTAARTDEERAAAALGLQRTHGNAYVQRLLGQAAEKVGRYSGPGMVMRTPVEEVKSAWDLVQDVTDVASAAQQIAAGGAPRAVGILELGLKVIDKLPKPPAIEQIMKYYDTHFTLLKDVLGVTVRSERIKAQLGAIEQNLLSFNVKIKWMAKRAEDIPSLATLLSDEALSQMDPANVEGIARLYQERLSAYDEALAAAIEKFEETLRTFDEIQAKWGEEYAEPSSSSTETIGKSLPYGSEIGLMVLQIMETAEKVTPTLDRAAKARELLQRRLAGATGYVQGPPRGE